MISDEMRLALRDVYKRQGYVVIGYPPGTTVIGIGSRVEKLFQFDLGREFEVVDHATLEDWDRQNDLVQELKPKWKRFPDARQGVFFKVRPVGKVTGKLPSPSRKSAT